MSEYDKHLDGKAGIKIEISAVMVVDSNVESFLFFVCFPVMEYVFNVVLFIKPLEG